MQGADVPHKLVETRTDAGGAYRVEIPGITGPTKVSLDAMKPGYRRLVGTLMSGGDPKEVEVTPGAEAEASLKLKPSLYFRGTVVDEQGKPISGVEVSANASYTRSSGGIERTATNPDGSFELFCYPEKLPDIGDGAGRGLVFFFHPDYIDTRIDDIYALAPKDRESVRVVLRTGYKVTGTVIGADRETGPPRDGHGRPQGRGPWQGDPDRRERQVRPARPERGPDLVERPQPGDQAEDPGADGPQRRQDRPGSPAEAHRGAGRRQVLLGARHAARGRDAGAEIRLRSPL